MKVIADVGPGNLNYYRQRAIEETRSGNLTTAMSILALAQYYESYPVSK